MKQAKSITLYLVCLIALAYHGTIHSAVLVTETELQEARAHIKQEPLQGYFLRLSQRGDESAAPVLYLLTGDKRYAVQANNSIKSNLESLRKYLPYKINIWTLHGPGWAESSLLAYDMTKESGVYTDQDIRDMKETLYWSVTHFLNEGKDHIGKGFLYQTDFIPEDHEDWVTANMNINRLVAVGLYALVFPGEPRSKEIIRYTVDYFERVLSLGSRPGGAWAESPRYASGVLRQLFTLAVALKNAGERDFLNDERFRKMLGFFAESIPAPEMPGPNKPTMLAAGDTDWYENGTAILSWAAPRYFTEDPKTAGEWMWCWKQSDAPLIPESLLFVNPGIEPVKPSYGSYLPGMGYVIFRDRFARPDETFFFATFGEEPGTSNRTMHLHPNHGDFSLIWRGHPVMLTRGCASYTWSRRMLDQVDFSHSVLSCYGAGESIAIPEKKYSGPAVEINQGVDETLLRDYYSDGLTNFLSTPTFDYAAGQVRNWDIGLPAPFNVRHFLFLKPDVFVIWDQVRSPYPLQWNLHLPADDVTSSGKTISLTNSDGVNLSIDFLQDEPLDYSLDWPLESIRAEWPVVLSCPYGKGMFIFNALDIARQVLDNNNEGAKRIIENLISYPRRPTRIGLIETDGQTEELLKRLGFTYELLDYKGLGGDLSRFDRIMVGHFGMLVRDRDLMDYREKLWSYVENGGVCYWAYEYAWGWKPGDMSGPGYFPHTLMVGEGTSVLWGEGIELTCPITMDDDPIWQSPNRITMQDWDGWQVGPPDTYKMLHYNTRPNTDRARNFPVYYSDYWQVHASALRTYIINPPRMRKRFGPYRWIKVFHQPSDDYLAVVRAWEGKGSGSHPAAGIVRGNEREAVITQGSDTWQILLGNHSGQTGNLAVFRYDTARLGASADKVQAALSENQRLLTAPQEMYLVDTTDGAAGPLRFSFDNPATWYFDFEHSAGRLSTLDGCTVRLPWKLTKTAISGKVVRSEPTDSGTAVTLPAGDYTLRLSGSTLDLVRICHVGQVEVVDGNGRPVQWVHIFRDLPGKGRTAFQGATDQNGCLTMRWDGDGEQGITISKDKKSVRASIRPGVQRAVFK